MGKLNDSLGDRMKRYEIVNKTVLTRRTPVIIRLDGKAFHTFTRGFKKPFDEILVKTMQDTMKYLCENIQGCVLGYTQSDEITLVLTDYEKLETDAWYDYEVEKMCSISASMATLAFNKAFFKNCEEYFNSEVWLEKEYYYLGDSDSDCKKYKQTMWNAMNKGAMFDSRVFNIPKEDVTNCVLWRQKDAERNSILSVGQANFSHKQLQNKSCKDIVAMLEIEKGVIWGNLPTTLKRGSCCIKEVKIVASDKEVSKWIIDNDIPRFIDEGREYIEKLI